ncbi:COG4315 family predicted lipoprotein [Mycolicibacterium pulveris]|uniref:COG4315 family predicted lipoprotein n=1 Tax=Mycolicibacterium pulveris TaxID=36813 RepID=UPI003CEABCC6
MPKPRTLAAILAVCALALTGCAAFTNKAATSSATSATQAPVAAPRTDAQTPAPVPPPSTTGVPPTREVSLAIDDRDDLGEIIVDSTGRALYAFSADHPNEPTCYDACADTWVPLLAGGDPAGTIGIDVASVESVPRRDGGEQVTYKQIPLYRYAGDNNDRVANGQGLDMFGGEWHVLTKNGQPLA